MKIKHLILVGVATLFLSSCVVSKKKYGEMENLKNNVQSMLDKKKKELKDVNEELDATEALLKDCEEKNNTLQKDTARLVAVNGSLEKQLTDLKATCENLNENYEQLKTKNSKKMRELIDQLESLQKDLEKREERLNEVEAKLYQRDSVMNSLRQKVSDALLGFQDQGLTVEIKNGKVYVSLSNKLLFASGSTQIDENGQNALRDLATVLKDQNDISIMVEGHTDDVPVKNLGQIKDNWDLSVMRSTEVVRLLVENGVEPQRVIPSGRGEFIPKVEEESKEARASNRRTEIIISPKLDELFDLIEAQH